MFTINMTVNLGVTFILKEEYMLVLTQNRYSPVYLKEQYGQFERYITCLYKQTL